MPTSNFDFLKDEYSELAKLGSSAEELIGTDAASCLSKLRLITEFIAKDIYYKYFNEKSKLSQFELLKEFKEVKKRSAKLEAELKLKEEALKQTITAKTEEFVNNQKATEEVIDRLNDLSEAQTRHFITDNRTDI